jgi:3-mercaptopyruvate sulfurtransferase SseA
VTYCEVGVRASLLALLHEIHAGQVVAVFDGSLMQWSLDPELPVFGRIPDAYQD